MAEQKSYDWGKLDQSVDLDALQEDIKTAEENGDRPDVPDGNYEVEITQMELKQSKKGDPMLSIWFKILSGEFNGSLIFYNGVMQPANSNAFGFQVHRNNSMLRDIWDAEDDEVKFKNFSQYAKLIEEIAGDVISNSEYQYELKQEPNKKNADFKDIEIVGILDVD